MKMKTKKQKNKPVLSKMEIAMDEARQAAKSEGYVFTWRHDFDAATLWAAAKGKWELFDKLKSFCSKVMLEKIDRRLSALENK